MQCVLPNWQIRSPATMFFPAQPLVSLGCYHILAKSVLTTTLNVAVTVYGNGDMLSNTDEAIEDRR